MDNETRERFERIEATQKDTNDLLNAAAKALLGLTESLASTNQKLDRIERHLEVLVNVADGLLVNVADGLIRDRRFRDLEDRVQRLEEQGRQAA